MSCRNQPILDANPAAVSRTTRFGSSPVSNIAAYADVDSITVIYNNTVMKSRLTLDELAGEVETLLAQKSLLEAQADGRISAAPDPRTVRYYTTLGLLDRPEIVAREARYARRHVLQLCA